MRREKTKIIIGFIFFFLFLNINDSFSFTTITSSGAGTDWATGANWVGGVVPDVEDWPNDKAIIAHNITYTGSLLAKASNGIQINAGCTLTVTGTLTLNGTALTIAATGVLICNAFTAETNAGIITNAGKITCTNAFALNHSGNQLLNTGTITCTTFSAVSDIENSGTITCTTSLTYNNTTGGQEFTSSGGTITTPTITVGGGSTPIINVTGGTLQCNGNLNVTGGGGMASGASGTINVTGNWNSSGSTNCTLGGRVAITGTLDANSGCTLTFNGTTTVGGNLSGTGTGTITVGGTLDVDGTLTLTNTSKLNGTGVATWGVAAVNDETSDGALICNGTRYDSDPGAVAAAIPNNPINLATCAAATLPVELISFVGKKTSDGIVLNWVTGSEINNDYFNLQSSIDGVIWNHKAIIKGQGNTYAITEYEFIDNEYDENLRMYYRLKQVDFNGVSSYSKILTVHSEGKINSNISVFPNPVANVLSIGVDVLDIGRYKMQIINNIGEITEEMEVFVKSEKHQINILVSGLENGMYVVVFTGENGRKYHKKFIKN